MGPEKERRAYRFAKSAGPRGRREKRTWAARENGKGPSALEGFLDFSKKKNQQREKDFWRGFGEKEKHIKICVELRGIFLILQNWFEPIWCN